VLDGFIVLVLVHYHTPVWGLRPQLGFCICQTAGQAAQEQNKTAMVVTCP
jgi:hypothetical protein